MNYTMNRRDKTEPEIVEALRNAGACVRHMPSGVGWDLTVIYRGVVSLGEVKSPGGKLTDQEVMTRDAIEAAGGIYYVWYTPDDALDDVVGIVA